MRILLRGRYECAVGYLGDDCSEDRLKSVLAEVADADGHGVLEALRREGNEMKKGRTFCNKSMSKRLIDNNVCFSRHDIHESNRFIICINRIFFTGIFINTQRYRACPTSLKSFHVSVRPIESMRNESPPVNMSLENQVTADGLVIPMQAPSRTQTGKRTVRVSTILA